MNTFIKGIILVAVLLLEGCYVYPSGGAAYVYPSRPTVVYAPRPPVFLAPRPPVYFSPWNRGWMGYHHYGAEMREHAWGRR
jgi:hypothetical protein